MNRKKQNTKYKESTATTTRLTPHMNKPKKKTNRKGKNSTARIIFIKQEKLSGGEENNPPGIIEKGVVKMRTVVVKIIFTFPFKDLFGRISGELAPLRTFLVYPTGISSDIPGKFVTLLLSFARDLLFARCRPISISLLNLS